MKSIEFTPDKACFFTGHRNLKNYDLLNIKNELEKAIETKYSQGITYFVSGGALGFDLIAANKVIEMKSRLEFSRIKLILYLPCKSYFAPWTKKQRNELCDIIELADDCIYTSERFHFIGCMKIRNQRLVDDCSCGIAFKTHNRSGTSQTVSMAEKQKKNVLNIAELI